MQPFVITFNPLAPRVKPCVTQSFQSFHSMDPKAVEQYFTAMLLLFQFSPVCNFGKFINFRLDIVRDKGVKLQSKECIKPEIYKYDSDWFVRSTRTAFRDMDLTTGV